MVLSVCSYCTVDLHLCFRIGKNLVFLKHCSFLSFSSTHNLHYYFLLCIVLYGHKLNSHISQNCSILLAQTDSIFRQSFHIPILSKEITVLLSLITPIDTSRCHNLYRYTSKITLIFQTHLITLSNKFTNKKLVKTTCN